MCVKEKDKQRKLRERRWGWDRAPQVPCVR